MVHVAKDQDRSVFLGKGIHCFSQRLSKLAPLQRLRGDFPPICEVPWDVRTVITLLSLLNGFVQVAPILSELHFRFVDRDLNEPRAELGFLTKPPQCFECLQHRFLSDFFGISFVLNDRYSRQEYGALVRLDQLVESFRLASFYTPYERLLEHVALQMRATLNISGNRHALRQHHVSNQTARHTFSPCSC